MLFVLESAVPRAAAAAGHDRAVPLFNNFKRPEPRPNGSLRCQGWGGQRQHFSPTYRVRTFGHFPCESEGVSSDPFGRTVRHGRSRERRSQRGRHHAKGTRYVGEIIAAMLGASAAIWSASSGAVFSAAWSFAVGGLCLMLDVTHRCRWR